MTPYLPNTNPYLAAAALDSAAPATAPQTPPLEGMPVADLIDLSHKVQAAINGRISAANNPVEELLWPLFRRWLDEHPQVACLFWGQWAPYFNDGDPCTWSIQSEAVAFGMLPRPDEVRKWRTVAGVNLAELPEAPQHPYVSEVSSFASPWRAEEAGDDDGVPAALDGDEEGGAYSWLHGIADLCERLLDDGVVLVHRGGIQVAHCRHD